MLFSKYLSKPCVSGSLSVQKFDNVGRPLTKSLEVFKKKEEILKIYDLGNGNTSLIFIFQHYKCMSIKHL